MHTSGVQQQNDLFADHAEIDRRMAEIKERLQPHFDRSALSAEQQASFYEHMRGQVPITMEQESRGASMSQLLNSGKVKLPPPDPAKVAAFMVVVKEKIEKYQAEAAAKLKGSQ